MEVDVRNAHAAQDHLCSGMVTSILSQLLQVNLFCFNKMYFVVFIVRLIVFLSLLANLKFAILYIGLEE